MTLGVFCPRGIAVLSVNIKPKPSATDPLTAAIRGQVLGKICNFFCDPTEPVHFLNICLLSGASFFLVNSANGANVRAAIQVNLTSGFTLTLTPSGTAYPISSVQLPGNSESYYK